jgi:hypothetical protein
MPSLRGKKEVRRTFLKNLSRDGQVLKNVLSITKLDYLSKKPPS